MNTLGAVLEEVGVYYFGALSGPGDEWAGWGDEGTALSAAYSCGASFPTPEAVVAGWRR